MAHDFSSSHFHDCSACNGTGDVWKYFKHEGEKVLSQVYAYCPVCHPNLAQPIVPNPGQEEIGYEEFNRLSRTDGWTVD